MENKMFKVRCLHDVTSLEDLSICFSISQFRGWEFDAAVYSIQDGTVKETPTSSVYSSLSNWVPTLEQTANYKERILQNPPSGLDSVEGFLIGKRCLS